MVKDNNEIGIDLDSSVERVKAYYEDDWLDKLEAKLASNFEPIEYNECENCNI